jgi:hypothetical protein
MPKKEKPAIDYSYVAHPPLWDALNGIEEFEKQQTDAISVGSTHR